MKSSLELPDWPPEPTGRPVHETAFKGAIWYGAQGEPHFVRLAASGRRPPMRSQVRAHLEVGLRPVIDRARPGRHR
ncbi:hypothetical protein ACIBL5_21650 [Streptomyces sp. NPDC050516]|uniref:hypothetical protein n=1 Tax=Streptomyces sp. NPDC050516 TaxID=3365621 RepID=UPI003794D37C